MTARMRIRFVALAFLAAIAWWTETASVSAGAASRDQCDGVCNEHADCDQYCEVDIYPTTCGEYNEGVANGMCAGECGDGYCNSESYWTCPEDCPNECDQGLGYWTEEVSRTNVGKRSDWEWGWWPFPGDFNCYRYWRVTARDTGPCNQPNRDYCEKIQVNDDECAFEDQGHAYSLEWGSTCDDLNLDCWLGNDCHD
jgi:hypothetical protein